MSRQNHNHRTQPTNDTKRKRKQVKYDMQHTFKTNKIQSNQIPFTQQGGYSSRQDPPNRTQDKTLINALRVLMGAVA